MGDRRWYTHEVNFMVPASGSVTVIIRMKGKWPRAKDFFLDNITLEAVAAVNGGGNGGSGGGEEEAPTAVAILHLPIGYQARTELAPGDSQTIVVQLPVGVNLQIVHPDAG
jgi:hypothetical protein